jgi:FMN phosphatase YigB (HAD superfamily)
MRVKPSQTLVVGDDEWCDVYGALNAGMRPVRFVGHRHWPPGASAAALVLTRISDLPGVATALLADYRESHAA